MATTNLVALLRGVNVGGKARVAMADVRGLFMELGFEHVQTVLQSGNVVFTTSVAGDTALEDLLERECSDRLFTRADFVVRSAAEWQRIIDGNPFPDMARDDPGHLLVMALKESVDEKAVETLRRAVTGPEVIEPGDRMLYITYPEGIGHSRLTNAVIESKLRVRGTARNWNTVVKVAALFEQ